MTMWRDRHQKIVIYRGEELGELYDLDRDPDEYDNRWDDPAYADTRFRLLRRCLDARVATAMDPLPQRESGY